MAESPTEIQLNSSKKAKVLIADDSKIVRVTISKILAADFDLVVAEDGEEAWQKIKEDDGIQVVFTDLGMPKLDGYGLIERIRQSDNEGIRNQPVIVITGAAEEEEVRRKVFELGATDFITKPFNSTEVIARAEAHANYRRANAALQKNVEVDLLTGALNPSGLSKQLQKDVSFVNRHKENMAIILFELDDFPIVHKRLGEQAANRIIKQVAATLLGAVRREDSVGRYAAEKFVALLPLAKSEGVVVLAKRLCECIQAFKISIGGTAIPVSMSAGIAAIHKGQSTSEKELLTLAEEALQNAKAIGKGEVQLLRLQTDTTDEAATQISIDSYLEAVGKGELKLTDIQATHIVARLKPLFSLMSEKHRQSLLKN
jgi:two-component system, cell cycle response regulator